MAKQLIHSFAIKEFSTTNVKRLSKGYTKIGAKRSAVVVKDKGNYYARLNAQISTPVEECDEQNNLPSPLEFKLLPFSPQSLELKGKVCVFHKNRDKRNRIVIEYRDDFHAYHFPGTSDKYDVFKEGIVISGHIIKMNGRYYFDYEEFISISEHINEEEDKRMKRIKI